MESADLTEFLSLRCCDYMISLIYEIQNESLAKIENPIKFKACNQCQANNEYEGELKRRETIFN